VSDRYYHVCGLTKTVNGDFVVVAAGGSSPGAKSSDVDVYHVKTNTWTTSPALPMALTRAGMTVTKDWRMFIVGGKLTLNLTIGLKNIIIIF